MPFITPSATRRLRPLGVAALALALALLQGCASAPAPAAARTSPTGDKTGAVPNTIPPQAQADLDAAMALLRAEQYEPSIAAFKKLAISLPDNPIPLINVALAYKKLDKLDLAEEYLKQALATEADNPVASNELALLYREKGRFAEARPIYENTLRKYPNFMMAHKNLGVLCDLYLRDYECALTHYKIYAQSAPDDKNVKIWIADLQKRSGK